MSGRRNSLALSDRRAISIIQDALKSGSLRMRDVRGAVDVLAKSLPHIRRMQRHAQENLASQALREAAVGLPPGFDEASGARDSSAGPETLVDMENQSQRIAARPSSSDLLPSVRAPRQPAGRKRRRVRESESADPSSGTSFVAKRPRARLGDVGGVDSILTSVRELVEWPLRHIELYSHLGVSPPRGILLHGPPGCGKTLLAHAIAGEIDVPLLRVSAPEIVAGVSGESERKVRELFAEASRLAPCIVFIDEIDTIASRREDASKDMGRRIVAQLLTCLDELSETGLASGSESAEEVNPATDREAPDERFGSEEHAVVRVNGPVSGQYSLHSNGGSVSKTGEGMTGEELPGIEALADDSSPIIGRRGPVVVIAATNRPEVLDPALRRAGRFDREIELGAPDDAARKAILEKLCRPIRLTDSCNFEELGKKTAGYVGADLELLVKEAAVLSIRRFASSKLIAEKSGSAMVDVGDSVDGTAAPTSSGSGRSTSLLLHNREPFAKAELADFAITMDDFVAGLETVQPSAMREGFATRPSVSWADVGALEQVREELTMAVVEPIRVPERFAALGLSSATGVLLYGPPGCGKTLLARAVASESGANFISVKGPELLSKYVGDSELAVRKLFNRARASSPCIVFFDELDALAPRRGGGTSGGGETSSGASERVVNMLLTEMDGFDVRKQVFLIAATNRPDIIDPAMLRPGRLEKLLYVPLPTEAGRVSILKTLLKNVAVSSDVDVSQIASDPRCSGFSGADMHALIRAAGENAMRSSLARSRFAKANALECVSVADFQVALNKVLPSVSQRDARMYRSLESSLRKSRAHLAPASESNDGTI